MSGENKANYDRAGAADDHSDDHIARRNVAVLIIIQALIGAMIPMHFLLGALAGKEIAPSPALATLPISMTIIGGMISAPIIGQLMALYGRVLAFLIASLIAASGLGLSAYAIANASFTGLCLGAILIGFYMAAQGFFRFAATDMASEGFRARAVSFTLIGGLAAAVIGPGLAARYSLPNMALPYLIAAALSFPLSLLYFLLHLPGPERGKKGSTPAQMAKIDMAPPPRIAIDRQILAAMLIMITGYAMMNLMMTSTPLAVEGVGYSRTNSANIVRAHVIAMFAPGFVTGYLIGYFGAHKIGIFGLALMGAASIIGLSGMSLTQFYAALILLGIGWNFAFIGGTSKLVALLGDQAGAKRFQAFSDAIMWSMVATASLSSGVLMNALGGGGEAGWRLVNLAILPIILVAIAAALWLMRADTHPKEVKTPS